MKTTAPYRLLCLFLLALASLAASAQEAIYVGRLVDAQEDPDTVEAPIDYEIYSPALLRRAQEGETWAQFCLAECYEFGKGVPVNWVEATRWYVAAAENDYHEACYAAGWFYEKGEGGVKQDYAEAAKWYLKGARDGNIDAMYAIARMYFYGKGVQQNREEAVRWLKQCVEEDFSTVAYAQNLLGICYYNGFGTPKNGTEALRWFRRAAEGGDEDALFNLNLCYRNGVGVAKNTALADEWLQKAVDKGQVDALNYLREQKEAEQARQRQLAEQQRQQQERERQQQEAQKLLYEGLYTATGRGFDILTGQYTDTGVCALHQVKIFGNRIVVDDKETALWKTNGDWLYYGCNEDEPIYLYNPKTMDLRWRFVFNFYGKHVSDNFWLPGNQMAQASGTPAAPQQGSYSNTPRTGRQCQFCRGSGSCTWVGHTYDRYYCHGSGICANCNGRGRVSASFGSSGTIDCSFCTNGRCGYCGGTGRCGKCGGSGIH